tara:strand:- start:2521 stop:2967 length:447 start_codon:yes stop_codon:yes gene_type:complete
MAKLNEVETLKGLRVKLNQVLAEVLESEGLTATIGNMNYERDGSQVRMKLTIDTVESASMCEFAKPLQNENITGYLFSEKKKFIITKDHIGKPVTINGKEMQFLGYKPKGRKKNWACGVPGEDGHFALDAESLVYVSADFGWLKLEDL